MKINSINTVSLGEVLEYEQPTKYIVDNTNYDDEFDIPVLTAGKSFLLGYTNETHNVFSNVPVIIFDDFTTAFKYVDFPFKVKSSAMKILKANKEIADIRFLYYRMMKTGIDTELHKRYWISKYSKVKISLPPLEQQKKIAAILDAADDYRQKTKALIEKYDELAQSLFLDMFGDPIINPKRWEKEILNNLCSKISVGFVGTCEPYYCSQDEGVPMLRTGNLGEGFLKFSNMKYVTNEFHEKQKKSQLFAGDLLIARHGDNGKAVQYNGEFDHANCLNIVILRPGEKLRSLYTLFLLNNKNTRKKISGRTGGATQKVVNTKEIQKLDITVPDIILQDLFVDRVKAIEVQKAQAQASLNQAEDLFNSLLKRVFKGELTS